MAKRKRTNNGLQNITQKTKDRTIRSTNTFVFGASTTANNDHKKKKE